VAQGAEADQDRGAPSVIRRKTRAGGRIARGARAAAASPARGLRTALARAANDLMGLALVLDDPAEARVSLAELLERVEDRALILLLAGPEDALGLCLVSPGLLGGLTEWQTMRRISATPPPPRMPTRTDASIVADWLGAVLGLFAAGQNGVPVDWAAGFRYSSYLPDPRPLDHLLEDVTYRLFTAEMALGGGARQGTFWLAFPADRSGFAAGSRGAEAVADGAWTASVERAVMGAPVRLDAVLTRLSLPLEKVMDFHIGTLLPLSMEMIDQVALEGPDGESVVRGRLGQSQGHRAIRIRPADQADSDAAPPDQARAAPVPAPRAGAPQPAPDG
jgi:flagellar motor switch protein FliM